MGNKTRLNEATVRRFMKLAKLPTVNEQFFNEEEEPMEEPAMEEPAAEEPAAEEEETRQGRRRRQGGQ